MNIAELMLEIANAAEHEGWEVRGLTVAQAEARNGLLPHGLIIVIRTDAFDPAGPYAVLQWSDHRDEGEGILFAAGRYDLDAREAIADLDKRTGRLEGLLATV